MNTKGEPNTRWAEPVHVSQQWGRKFLHHRSVTFTCREQNMGSLSPYGQSEVENKSSAYLKVVELNNSMSIEKENSVMKNNIYRAMLCG